ncbi:E3 ubiquitin-protein ligase HECTD2, partial [Lecanoromycetidae sp. Uapishka_2]
MEHDARRQMEIKAREAFFNSIMSRKAISQYLVLKVRRDCLVEDSLRGVSEVVGQGQEEIKKGLKIEFQGEEGQDSGGLRKEWFLLLVREVFDREHGLFVYDEESHYCYFNPNTFETSDQFFLVGVLLGLAIYNSTILDVALPPFAFRKLLASAPNYTGPATSSSRPAAGYTLEDLAEFRPSLANGLSQMLEFDGNVEDTFCQHFVAGVERYGQREQVPLCPNGERRSVTNGNRREFVELYIRYLLDTSVARQYEPFKRGFFTVCGGNALSLFRPEEIELLVRGSDEPLDVATLRSVASYDGWGKGSDPADEPVVTWFWEAFGKADVKSQRKLLSFITASDRIPAMGTTSLVIKIICLGDYSQRFPIARTCFNMLGLYKYSSRAILEDKLWRAVVDSEGFGMK